MQIEKTTFVSCFCVERFHQFVYGRHLTVENDHKLLKFILNKPVANVPARIERLMLRLQRYSFDFVWIPEKQMHIADVLSRAPGRCHNITIIIQ